MASVDEESRLARLARASEELQRAGDRRVLVGRAAEAARALIDGAAAAIVVGDADGSYSASVCGSQLVDGAAQLERRAVETVANDALSSPTPLVLADGAIVATSIGRHGWMAVERHGDAPPFVPSDAVALGHLASIVVAALEVEASRRRAAARARFLVEASGLLGSTFDVAGALARISELAVSTTWRIADWVTVVIDDGNGLRRVAAIHRDPARSTLAAEYLTNFSPTRHRASTFTALGNPQRGILVREVSDEDLARFAHDDSHRALLDALGCRSTVVVPMVIRGSIIGVLSFVRGPESPSYDDDDLAFAEEIAVRAALALEAARRFADERSAQEAAERARRELETLFEAMPQLGWSARPDGWIDHFNRGFYEFTDTTLAEVQGWGWQKVHDPAELPRIVEAWRNSLETGTPFQMELRIRRHDGAFRWFLTRGSPIRDGDGNIVRWVGIHTDIHDRKTAEADKAALLEKAEEASRAKDQFLAMLGHELRNPLAPITTALEIMRLRGDSSTVRERAVLERQTAHLTHLVDDLLDVSRVIRGKIDIRRTRLDVRDVIRRAVEVARPLLEERHHTLTLALANEPLLVDGDEVRLQQVVTNLLTNAARYTEPAGHVRVSADVDGGAIVVRVKDDGRGIAPELLATIFEPFVQGPRASDRAEGGLGLGLALVRAFVSLHGGTVEAHSEGIGRGSELTVRLPIAKPVAAAATIPPQATAAPSRRRARRVLVVDDNEDAADLLAEVLRADGHEVEVAYHPADALARAASFRPEVALLDIGLPTMDGYALFRQLRTLPGLAAITAFAVTGYGQDHDRARSRAAGLAGHFVKPVNPAEVLRVVAAAPSP